MKLTEMRPMFWVDDIAATIEWYKNVLGFNVSNYVSEWEWGVISRDGIEIMFAKPNEHAPYSGPAFSGSFYFTVDDADAWYEQLKTRADIYYPIEDFEYGMREFAVRDCNGFILQFGHDISQLAE